MTFSVVDIPKGNPTPSSPIIEAMVANVGKAISVPLEGKDANNYRKTLRATIQGRGLLKTYNFRTRIDEANKALVVWFEKIENTGMPENRDAINPGTSVIDQVKK